MTTQAQTYGTQEIGASLIELQATAHVVITRPGCSSSHAFDRKAAKLFSRIRKDGSLRRAACNCPMSYSRAWQMVKDLEEAFKIELVVRRKPYGYELTEYGNALLDAYDEIAKDASSKIGTKYEKAIKRELEVYQ